MTAKPEHTIESILKGLINFTAVVRGHEAPYPDIPLADLHAAQANVERLQAQQHDREIVKARLDELRHMPHQQLPEMHTFDDNGVLVECRCYKARRKAVLQTKLEGETQQ